MSSDKVVSLETSEEVLKRESLKEDNFSSHSHSMESFGREVSEFARATDFDIPERYYENRLVILPVNVRTEFIYWELNEDYVKSMYDGVISNYTIRLFEYQEGGERELTRFSVSGNIGRYYLNYYAPNRNIYVSMGIVGKDGKFIELLRSNRVTTPADTISSEQDEVWLSKVSDWMEVIHASLERISDKSGSAALLKEMELLRRHQKMKVEIDTNVLESLTSSAEFLGSSDMVGSSGMNLSSTENIKK